VRTYADAEGRFALRWRVHSNDDVLVVHPHSNRGDEFAILGPMGVEEALSREHVLEITTSVRVPAILRNVHRGDRYRYFVWFVDGDVALNATLGGAPIEITTDGEARTTLLLPSDRRARITIGYSEEESYRTDSSSPVDYDPAKRSEPLVFDIQPRFANVSGRVVGFDAAELAHVSVGISRPGDQAARMTRVEQDGAFEITGVSLGNSRLALLLDEGRGRAKVLAILPLKVESEVRGVVLARDPTSLKSSTSRDD
jgi:hypothetical protein